MFDCYVKRISNNLLVVKRTMQSTVCHSAEINNNLEVKIYGKKEKMEEERQV